MGVNGNVLVAIIKGMQAVNLKMMVWQWQQLDHMQITCTSLQIVHASTSILNFFRSDALPDTQPTVSKH